MIILAIETSCDETSIAIIKDGPKIVSNCVYSQIKHHSKHGGVVPEIASRMHAEKFHYILDQCLEEAKISSESPAAGSICSSNDDCWLASDEAGLC